MPMAARAIPQGFPSRTGMRAEQAQLADRIHHGNLHRTTSGAT